MADDTIVVVYRGICSLPTKCQTIQLSMRYRGIFAVLLDGGGYGCRWISEYIGITI